MNANLYAVFAAAFPVDRTRPFIELEDGTIWSYGDLEKVSSRFASLLSAMGVCRGDRVLAQTDKSPENLFLYLACLRKGAVYVPLNPSYTSGELGYFLRDAEPALIVCRPESAGTCASHYSGETAPPRILTLARNGWGSFRAAAEERGGEPNVVHAHESDVASLLYTSGTTGRPKGAMLTHGNLASNARVLSKAWGFRANDALLHALPLFHTHGLLVATHCTLISGSRMLFLPRFDAAAVLRLLPRCTVMMGVPTYYTRLLAQEGLDRQAARTVRLFISGSAPLREEDSCVFQARTGHTILERYGMTETLMNTSNPLEGERHSGTVGSALPGVELRIVGSDGNPVATGEKGMLEVRGPNVFPGYWQRAEENLAAFRDDGFFITGDIAVFEGGNRVRLVGRSKDQVISGGLNVYPREVEAVVDSLPGIEESAVVGVRHPDFGEAVIAVAVRRNAEVLEPEVVEACRERLANFKVPKRVIFVDRLPRNAMGKVQKVELRERYGDTLLA